MLRGTILPLATTFVLLTSVGCGSDDTKDSAGSDGSSPSGGSETNGSSDDERNVARSWSEWKEINPVLEMYAPLHEEFVPEMGIHWGVQGPHLTVGVGHDDIVTLVELIVPEEAGWQPWFDQAEGEPTELEGLGTAYTQHIWVTERSTVLPEESPVVLHLTLEALTSVNPALNQYEAISEYVPGMGIHYGAPGPAVVLAASEEGDVNAFELISPVSEGWFPWFDQPEGEPMDIEGLGEVYTQHLYVVDRESVD